MKLAIVIALAPDRRSGRVLSDILPADKAVDQVKLAITRKQCPDARFPIIQALKLDSKIREHRFRVLPEDVATVEDDDAPQSADVSPLIPVEIDEGEQMVIINVSTQQEADFLKQLADATKHGCDEIKRLQSSMSDAVAAHQSAIATSAADLQTRTNELEAAASQKAKLVEVVAERDARIAELEAQLAEATAKTKKTAK